MNKLPGLIDFLLFSLNFFSFYSFFTKGFVALLCFNFLFSSDFEKSNRKISDNY